jgi:hypothetical protein
MYGSISLLPVSGPVLPLTNISTFQIDALCIVQDDIECWRYEASHYASSIGGADLVLAASTTYTESLLPERKQDTTVSFQVIQLTTLLDTQDVCHFTE